MASLSKRPRQVFGAALAALLLVLAAAAQASEVDEASLKVAFIYNFAYFSVWPNEHGGQLKLCVHDDDAELHVPIRALGGRRVRSMTIAVRQNVPLSELRSCHLAFVPMSSGERLSGVLNAVAGAPVLVVADIDGGAQLGAAISLLPKGQGRLEFEVNVRAVRAAGLKLSSRVIELAHKVY